ncbi:MAG: hypothetical protein PHW24_00545 [Candidatus Moranbacteria bacterium]|nr:hypothetical protein [Candidatus Moranbacteria bacterium]
MVDKIEIVKKNWAIIVFTILTLVFSLWYVAYVNLHGGLEYLKNRTIIGEVGNIFGKLGFFALAFVYARSVLKIVFHEESFWKRLEPLNIENFDLRKFSTKLLIFMNKTHAYFGVMAIVFIFMHCYLTGSYRDNLLLQIVLALMVIEGISGFFLKFKYSPNELRQKSHLVHRQFVIGIMLLIFAAFGHLILEG